MSNYLKHKFTTSGEDGIVALMEAYEEGTESNQGYYAYGLFWALVEKMAIDNTATISPEKIGTYAKRLSIPKYDLVYFLGMLSLPHVALFIKGEDGSYTSPRLQRNLDEIAEVSQKARDRVAKRWGKQKDQEELPVIPQYNQGNTINELINKEKNNRGELPQISLFDDEERPIGGVFSIPPAPAPEKPAKEPTKRFTPPTQEELVAYLKERKIPNAEKNAIKFTASYEQKGWMVGKSKMKDWRKAVQNWEVNEWFILTQEQSQGTGTAYAPGGRVQPGVKIRL